MQVFFYPEYGSLGVIWPLSFQMVNRLTFDYWWMYMYVYIIYMIIWLYLKLMDMYSCILVEIYHVAVLHYVQNKPIRVASNSAILLARHPSRSSTVPRLPHDRHHHYWAPTLVVTRTAVRWHLEIGQESAFLAFCGKKVWGISGVRNVWWFDMKMRRLVCVRPSESLQQESILLDG